MGVIGALDPIWINHLADAGVAPCSKVKATSDEFSKETGDDEGERENWEKPKVTPQSEHKSILNKHRELKATLVVIQN